MKPFYKLPLLIPSVERCLVSGEANYCLRAAEKLGLYDWTVHSRH